LILIYKVLEEENIDQKSPALPGWGMMQRFCYSLIIKKEENQIKRLGKEPEIDNSS
jgi:hypothetical protein